MDRSFQFGGETRFKQIYACFDTHSISKKTRVVNESLQIFFLFFRKIEDISYFFQHLGVKMLLSWSMLVLLAVSFLCAGLTGQMDALSQAVPGGAAQGVQLVLALSGTLCLWSGLNRMMEATGIQRGLARLLRPLLRLLFPHAVSEPKTLAAISANVTANLLGLGNAATPLGIEAVRRMQDPRNPRRATDEMCRFLVLNTASVQLLPTTVAALRASSGAAQPFDIFPCVLMTSLCSVLAGESAAFLFARWSRS